MLTAESKLPPAVLHCRDISIYFTCFQTYGQNDDFMLIVCRQTTVLSTHVLVTFSHRTPLKHKVLLSLNHKFLKTYAKHHLPNKQVPLGTISPTFILDRSNHNSLESCHIKLDGVLK